MTTPIGSILAGSKSFVSAHIALLASRCGVLPRVAVDPQRAFSLCQQGSSLLVIEYQDQAWIPVIEDLRRISPPGALTIIAAVAAVDAPTRDALLAAGVDDVVSWDGFPDAVLASVDQAIGSAMAAPDLEPIEPETTGSEALPLTDPFEGAGQPLYDDLSGPGGAAALGFTASTTWPGNVPGAAEGEQLLQAALAGIPAGRHELQPITQRVVAVLSDLEKQALGGQPLAVNANPIRRAAGLRWQVWAALATAPGSGSGVDRAVVDAMLAEIDDTLGQMKALGDGAPEELRPQLDALRRALVKEAIDLTEAVARIAPAESPIAVAPAAISSRAKRTRMVSYGAKPEDTPPRSKAIWVALAVSIAIAVAYHGYGLLSSRHGRPDAPTLAGAPAGMVRLGSEAGPITMLTTAGPDAPDPHELERFKAQEALKGNEVKEVAPGVVMVKSGPQPAGGGIKP